VNPENTVYSDLDGVLFDQRLNRLIQFPGGLSISYTIPGSVTNIGSGAFAGCANLTSVTIPNSVTSIGSDYVDHYGGMGVFQGCASLTSVTIPGSVTFIEGGIYNSGGTFQDCTSLTNVTIGNGVTSISGGSFGGGGAFQGCTSLTSVTIPSSVTSIEGGPGYYGGGGAFEGCTSLTGVYFEGNAPSDDSSEFSGAYNATVYYLPGTTNWGAMFGGRPTALWLPSFGLHANSETNGIGFSISWANNRSVVVEACTNLTNPVWYPIQTNTTTGDSLYFSDPQWTNYSGRFYRVRSP
jgi:BspA type Leucine rich repeat region (6 copies)